MADTMQDMEHAGAAAPLIEERVPIAQPPLGEAATRVGAVDVAAARAAAPSAEELAVARLVRSERARGAALTGPDGLLKALTKTVIETALDEDMTEQPGVSMPAA